MPRCAIRDVGWGDADDRTCWVCGVTVGMFTGNPPRPSDAMRVTRKEEEA